MSFLAPYMLLGTLAAGIPIALHFFYKSRYRNVPWGAMKFLLAAIEQTSRRLQFQELLLLILRVVLLLLLALALARPASMAGRGARGEAVDAVLILDQSLSMGAKAGVAPLATTSEPYVTALKEFAAADGSVTCFDRARAAALAIVANLPPHSTVQVIACDTRAHLLGPRTPSQLDQARTLIEELKLSHLATDYLPALREANDLLERGPSPNKELYLIGDMQRTGFEAQSGTLSELVAEMRTKVSLHFVHCATNKLRNVAIVGITPQSTLRAGERNDFAVLVRNTSQEIVRNLTVSLEADGNATGRDTQALSEIRPGELRAVGLSVVLQKPGKHVLTATVKPDDLDDDNRFDQVIHVSDQIGVLLVDGAPDPRDARRSASYFLQHALDPITPGETQRLPVTLTTAERAAPRDLEGKELCVLVNARLEPREKEEGGALLPEFARAVGTFVQEGKPLVIVAGNRVEAEPYNRVLFDQQALLPYRIAKVENAPAKKNWTLDRTSAEEVPYKRFRDEQGYAGIDRIEVRRALGLDIKSGDDDSRVLLRYSNGTPAIVSRKRPGQGEVILFTTSLSDPAWSDWYVAPAFVPFVQVTLAHLLEGQPQALNRVAGESIVWQVPTAETATAFDVMSPGGERERIGFPIAAKGRATLTTPSLTRAGLYRVLPAAQEVNETTPMFAVVPDVRETEGLECLQSAQIDTRLKVAGLHVKAGDDGAVFSGAERLKREWTPWLLGLLLVLVVGEMLFAWYCGRSW